MSRSPGQPLLAVAYHLALVAIPRRQHDDERMVTAGMQQPRPTPDPAADASALGPPEPQACVAPAEVRVRPTPPQAVSHWPGLPPPYGLALTSLPLHPCPYLPGRQAQTRAFACRHVPGPAYQRLMDAGLRRSGHVFYQPVCPGCRDCWPIRVPVETFSPSRSQRRVLRRNEDLSVRLAAAEPTREKHDLYQRYLAGRHDGKQQTDYDSFVEFLYASSTDTMEVQVADAAGELLGVGVCDLTPTALSSVYFYFDPSHARRSLGVFSALMELRVAAELGKTHYYLGYWVPQSKTMHYKRQFAPCEVLCPDGAWRLLEAEG